jgi:hypothetical protein
VETQYGFHVHEAGQLVPSRVKPYADVREDLIAIEKQKYIDEEKTAVAEAIRPIRRITCTSRTCAA